VRDYARRFLSRHQESIEAIGVIDMAMRIDRGVHRHLCLLAQHRGDHGRELLRSGIDQNQPFIRLECRAAGELRGEPGSRRHLDRAAGPEEFGLFGRFAPHRAEFRCRVLCHFRPLSICRQPC
jgi:hypothetical protein